MARLEGLRETYGMVKNTRPWAKQEVGGKKIKSDEKKEYNKVLSTGWYEKATFDDVNLYRGAFSI